MDSIAWRRYLNSELERLEVVVETLPSGVKRLSNRHGFMTLTDVIHLTESDLRTFAGKQQNLTSCRA